MKRLLLFMILIFAFVFNANAGADKKHLYVGETFRFEVSGAFHIRGMRWSASKVGISLSSLTNTYCDVKITDYFTGTATIVCNYEEKDGAGITSNASYKKKQKKWTVECWDNPISISPTRMTLNVGEVGQLTYNHEKNTYLKYANVYFKSANTDVVTVTSDGKVTAKAPGTALVNVYSKLTGGAPYCTITVKEAKATAISLQETIDMFEGQVYSVSPTITPSGATVKLTWSSDNESVVKVSSDGVMTALKDGAANITVKTDNGLSAKSKIVVSKGPDQIKLIPGTITLYVGYGYKINPVLVPENSKTAISIKSSDTSIAMLTDSYFITGVKPGKTTVVVKSSNGKETTCTINVIDTKPEYQGNAIKEKTNSLDILMKKTLNNTAF